jgi:hypothetical protein
MRALIAVACFALSAFTSTQARAVTYELPYNYYKLEQKITVTPQDGRKAIKVAGNVSVTDYRIVEHYTRTALVTLTGRKSFVASTLLYTSTAVYVVNPGLVVPSDHQTTVSSIVPTNVPSLLRVLIFDRMPDTKVLANFAGRPATAASQYLIGDAWLSTDIPVTSTGVLYPWEETFRYFTRYTGGRSRWPYAYARLDDSSDIVTKDCQVSYSGLPTSEIGEHGPIGAWPLEIAESWSTTFYVPPHLSYRRALLMLRSLPAGTEYDLRLNGFNVPVLPDENGVVGANGIDLGSYLQGGSNKLELRAPTFGRGGRLVSFELWID